MHSVVGNKIIDKTPKKCIQTQRPFISNVGYVLWRWPHAHIESSVLHSEIISKWVAEDGIALFIVSDIVEIRDATEAIDCDLARMWAEGKLPKRTTIENDINNAKLFRDLCVLLGHVCVCVWRR